MQLILFWVFAVLGGGKDSSKNIVRAAAPGIPFFIASILELVSYKRSRHDPGHNMGLGSKNRQ